jgi:hypothetical protein
MTGPGSWDKHYASLRAREPYGDQASYEMAAEWVSGCDPIEDWGCGKGWLRTVLDNPDAYVGIDGSYTPFAHKFTDLTTYTSKAQGIVLRHVLEHSHQWPAILANALESFTKRLCIVLFTPLADETVLLHTEPDYDDVPVYSFKLEDITDPIRRAGVHSTHIAIPGSFYGQEIVIRAYR